MYRLQLLSELKDENTLNGPMSPMGAAEEMAKAKLIPPFTQLWRVWFDADATHQVYEGPGKSGLTGYDTLITYSPFKNTEVICMFIDQGVKICPVTLYFSNDPLDDLEFAPVYENADFHTRPTLPQLKVLIKDFQNRAAEQEAKQRAKFN